MLNQQTISELAVLLERREVSARQIMQACLKRIESADGRIHAFISVDPADALAEK